MSPNPITGGSSSSQAGVMQLRLPGHAQQQQRQQLATRPFQVSIRQCGSCNQVIVGPTVTCVSCAMEVHAHCMMIVDNMAVCYACLDERAFQLSEQQIGTLGHAAGALSRYSAQGGQLVGVTVGGIATATARGALRFVGGMADGARAAWRQPVPRLHTAHITTQQAALAAPPASPPRPQVEQETEDLRRELLVERARVLALERELQEQRVAVRDSLGATTPTRRSSYGYETPRSASDHIAAGPFRMMSGGAMDAVNPRQWYSSRSP